MARNDANGQFTKETDVAKEDDDKRAAAIAEAQHEPTPFSMTHHPDGKPKMLTLSRPDGKGERRITAEQWDQKYSKMPAGDWVIKHTEIVAPHHSDDAF